MSHNISTKPGFKPCGCHEKRDKDKVDLLTKEYEELIAQLKAAIESANAEHDYWQSKAASLEGLALEKNATANKNAILEAIAAIEPYVALTDSEMDAIFGIVTPENTMWLDDNGILHTPFEVVDGVLKTNLSVNDNILN